MAELSPSRSFYFHYNSAGEMIGYAYRPANGNATECLLIKNLQGDVERIISDTGAVLASYTYDAWGNLCQSSGSLANINPIRYRSYYYDPETGLYYLQSRYYDPHIGRFVNADGLIDLGAGCEGINLFIYSVNNPVKYYDDDGHSAILAIYATYAGVASLTVAGVIFYTAITNQIIPNIEHVINSTIQDRINGLKEAQRNHILNNKIHDHKWEKLFNGKKPDWSGIAPIIYKVLQEGKESIVDESKGLYIKSLVVDGYEIVVRYLKDMSGEIIKISDGWVK